MITVALHGAEFFARHGFYPAEQVLGGRFTVDVEVGFLPFARLNDDDLINTLNYEQLYQVAYGQMQQTRKLIETVAQGIMDEIKQQYAYAEIVRVSVKKLNPPFNTKVASSEVTITYNKADNGI